MARMIVTQFNTEVTPPTPAVPIHEMLPQTHWTFAYLGPSPDQWSRQSGMSRRSSLPFDDDDPQVSFCRVSESTTVFRERELRSTQAFFDPEEPPPPAA